MKPPLKLKASGALNRERNEETADIDQWVNYGEKQFYLDHFCVSWFIQSACLEGLN